MIEENEERVLSADYAIRLVGQGGHSSVPFKTRNPITAAAQLMALVESGTLYAFDGFDNVVIRPSFIDAGTKANIIPSTAELGFHAECASEAQREKIGAVIRSSLEAVATGCGVSYSMEVAHG